MSHREPRAPASRRRRVPLALMAAVGAVLLAGCGRGGTFSRADLVVANSAEPETLDPALVTGQSDQRICYALFEGLTSFDAHGQPQPGVASSWDISADRTQYTFHLRPEARWSDGEPVTASDFVVSWQRVLTPATTAQYAYQLFYLRNGRAYNEARPGAFDFAQVGVRALDDATLQVTLERATPFFLDLCCTTTFQPVPRRGVERWGDAWIKPEHIVTNGPYRLESWRLNDKIRLRRDPHYWNRATVGLETIDVLPISHANVALNFFSSGVCDLLMDKGLVPVSLIGELRQRPFFHAAPFLGTYFLRFNCSRAPFDDPRVRQAFSLVIDKRSIVEKITKAGELPAASLVPPGTAGYEPPTPGLAYDPPRARALLAAAGYPGGAHFPPVAFLYNESEQNQYIGVELKSMFERELGISIGLSRQENKVYLSTVQRLDYDFARASWIGDYADPNTFLDLWVSGSGNNRTGWSDPRYDAWIAAAAQETDPTRRLAIFRQAEQLLISEATPICPLYFYVGIQLYDGGRVGGIEPNLLDVHPLAAMYRRP